MTDGRRTALPIFARPSIRSSICLGWKRKRVPCKPFTAIRGLRSSVPVHETTFPSDKTRYDFYIHEWRGRE